MRDAHRQHLEIFLPFHETIFIYLYIYIYSAENLESSSSSIAPLPFESKLLFLKYDETAYFPIRADE